MPQITTRSRFWGPLWPDVWDVPGRTFWGPLWPDPGPALTLVEPVGPEGVATFVADLDGPLDVTLAYETEIAKSYDGQERRSALLDYPRRNVKGSALLVGGAAVRTLRTQFARYAAQGSTFLLGLPFESVLLTADASGTSVFISSTAIANNDWILPGRRVVVLGRDRSVVSAVIQSASGSTVVLDVAPGATGKAGGVLVPTVPIVLAPQQGLGRYLNPEGVERWTIDATATAFGWQTPAVKAKLSGQDAGAGALDEAFFQAVTAGSAGNSIRVAMNDDSLSGVNVIYNGNDVTIEFQPGISTVADLAAALANGSLLRLIGSWNTSTTLEVTDQFAFMNLSGGSDGSFGTEGNGATVVTHAARPVFDRRTVVQDTAAESMQAMNDVVDLGGLPASVGQATMPDWGRLVSLRAELGAEWQWFKKFLATVRGRQRGFWLPTWRKDLDPVSTGSNTLTIEGPADSDGGFTQWFPTRDAIQIVQADGTITRATIASFVDNGNGTLTLTIGVTLSGSPIAMVSWLELCRLESDDIQVRIEGHIFSVRAIARAVRR